MKFQLDSDKIDFEKCIERLVSMKKALDKKEKERRLRNIRSRFFMRKTLRFQNFQLMLLLSMRLS